MAEEPLFYISHPGPGAGAGTANGLKLDTSPLCWLYLWKNNTREHGILKFHAKSNLLLQKGLFVNRYFANFLRKLDL